MGLPAWLSIWLIGFGIALFGIIKMVQVIRRKKLSRGDKRLVGVTLVLSTSFAVLFGIELIRILVK